MNLPSSPENLQRFGFPYNQLVRSTNDVAIAPDAARGPQLGCEPAEKRSLGYDSAGTRVAVTVRLEVTMRTKRERMPVATLCLTILCSATLTLGQTAPVEQRAEAMFDVLRSGDTDSLRAFLDEALHPAFLEMGPLEMHVEQFEQIRDELGAFEVDDIRISDPYRGEFILRSGSGEALALTLETEPIAPYRLAGIGLDPHEPDHDVPEFSDLEGVDRFLSGLTEEGAFSGVLLTVRDGENPRVRAYGMANKEKGLENTAETRFNIGSITKSLTGVAVLQLVERGKIDLEAPMSRYLKGFAPEIADRVRVIDLLRMESGFGDYYSESFEKRREELLTVSDYLELFRSFSLEFEPGSQERYSNVGYVVLGGIVESVSGKSYDAYVRKRIFAPAGMTGSSFRDLSKEVPRAAIGYTNDGPSGRGGYTDTNVSILDIRGNPSGGSYSPAIDLLRFERALHAGKLLSETNTTFLLNFYTEQDERPTIRGVAGGAPGVSSVSLRDSAAGVTVIVLSNYDEPLAEQVGKAVFTMMRDSEELELQVTPEPIR
jgi:CubicO group peptidase (beta-lactamase class C family)